MVFNDVYTNRISYLVRMKIPRKLKKYLTKKYGTEIVKRIVSGDLLYKTKETVIMTNRGWKIINSEKSIFIKIN